MTRFPVSFTLALLSFAFPFVTKSFAAEEAKVAKVTKETEETKEATSAEVKYKIEIDTSETPDLKEWVDGTLRPVCETWYPKIVAMLPTDGYTPPQHFKIKFDKDMKGVAYTAGTDVHCAAPWFRENLKGEAAGAVVHEMVHVVQQYGRKRRGKPNPGWLVEGVADYVRWFNYEPKSLHPRVNPKRSHYYDSYRTTAAFLNYAVETHDKELVKKFNTAMLHGDYDPELWKKYTGKTAEELWDEYMTTLTKK